MRRLPDCAGQGEATPLIIVGAGPAGLAAGMACLQSKMEFCIVDIGKPLGTRNHNDPADLGHGTGGAGLYSDGKFSFFPSGTQLWTLQPRRDLETSYRWLMAELRRVGVRMHDIPSAQRVEALKISTNKPIVEKSYPSIYATLPQRKALIQGMENALAGRIYSNTTVTQIAEHRLGCQLTLARPPDCNKTLTVKFLLLASGRFGPLLIHRSSSVPKTFRRLEVGIRIEQSRDDFFLAAHPQVDPKYIISDEQNGIEYRTFCCCRDGEIVAIEHDGISALSGRSDVVNTGRSNVGFHLRVLDEAVAVRLWPALSDRLRASPMPSRMAMADLLNAKAPEDTPVGQQLGPEVAQLIAVGLKRLIAHVGEGSLSDAIIHSPAVEGFFEYPAVDSRLRIPDTCIWAAGDVNGRFRGLVAALVSGYFAGLQIAQELRR